MTLISLLANSVSYRWERESHNIDLIRVADIIQERQHPDYKRSLEPPVASPSKEVKKGDLSKDQKSILESTVKSESSSESSGSSDINDVIQELEWLEKGAQLPGGDLIGLKMAEMEKQKENNKQTIDTDGRLGDMGGHTHLDISIERNIEGDGD